MKRTKTVTLIAGILMVVLGIAAVFWTRPGALGEGAGAGDKILFALSLICTLCGAVTVILGVLPERKPVNVRTLSMAALFAALCYIGFTYAKIDIPVGAEKTAFHLGNVFCVLAASGAAWQALWA